MDPYERIKALSERGNEVEVDPNVPLKRYYRSGMEMAKMALVYEQEGNLESSFILYIRFITLFVEKVRTHPEYHNFTPVNKKNINKKLNEVFPKAEFIKSKLRQKYYEEQEQIILQQKKLEKSIEEEQLKRKTREKESYGDESKRKDDGVKDESQSIYNNLIITHDHYSETDPTINDLIYPTNALNENTNVIKSQTGPTIVEKATPDDLSQIIPSRASKPPSIPSVPSFSRETKPPSGLLSTNFGEKETGLRKVIVPADLMDTFLDLAHSNTVKNVETCGILAGKLELNRFSITHLLVPKQSGSADSCITENEELLFETQDKYDLITLGWIHTHPSQTAFLSSVDLHTHCSYQLMMPEALAIVCAPKYNETGFFTLTPNHGLSFISECRKEGFHPHPKEPPLFCNAEHVIANSSKKINVVDLR